MGSGSNPHRIFLHVLAVCNDVITDNKYYFTEDDDEEVWEDSDESEFEDTNYESSQSPTLPSFEWKTPQSCQTIALSMWLIGFILRLQAKYYVPEAALDGLIKFLYVFLSLLARLAPSLKPLLEVFPHSLYDTKNFIHRDDSFSTFVVCPKCDMLYSFKASFDCVGSQKYSKKCSHIRYPDHP